MVTPGGSDVADLLNLVLDALCDGAGVLAHQHHDDTGHGLAPAVARGRALADHRREARGRNVAHVDRRAVVARGDDDVADVLEPRTRPSPRIRYCSDGMLDVAAAGVRVVALESHRRHLPIEMPYETSFVASSATS